MSCNLTAAPPTVCKDLPALSGTLVLQVLRTERREGLFVVHLAHGEQEAQWDIGVDPPEWVAPGTWVRLRCWHGGVFVVACDASGTPTGPNGFPMRLKVKRTARMHRGKRIRTVQEYWYCAETGQHVQDPEQEYACRTRLDAAYARMMEKVR